MAFSAKMHQFKLYTMSLDRCYLCLLIIHGGKGVDIACSTIHFNRKTNSNSSF